MEELYMLLVKLGPGWMAVVILGVVVGSVIFIIQHRQQIKLIKDGHAEQIKILEGTIAMLKQALEELKIDRNNYRENLHEAKNQLNALRLHQVELEGRPDLTEILRHQSEQHREKMEVNVQMLRAMENMQSRMDREFTAHANTCAQTVKMIDGLVKYLVKAKVLPDDYKV